MNNYFLGLLKALIAISILDYIYLKSTSNIFFKLVNTIQKSPLKLRIYPTIMVYVLIFLMWVVFIYNGCVFNWDAQTWKQGTPPPCRQFQVVSFFLPAAVLQKKVRWI